VADILLFTPKHELDCRKNLKDFVAMCRDQLTVFGDDLDWHANAWPNVGNFTVRGAPSRGYTEEQVLNADILPFAKAYVRYHQGHHPTKLRNEFKALRCIEEALLTVKGTADITLVDMIVMDVAGQVARKFGASSYQAGTSLKKLVDFLNESGIVRNKIEWHNSIKKPKEINRTDSDTQQKRAAKLPDEYQLDAMAEMFANDLPGARDRFTTSIFGLLMCAPSRIHEIQLLPADCLHEEMDSEGKLRVGLRFYAGKGFGADIKWIPTAMVDVAREAVRRLIELSEEGRKLARWYEEHPDRFYRHADCPRVPDGAPLSSEQVCQAMGFIWDGNISNLHARFKSFPAFNALLERGEPFTLDFLNDFCHSKLPKGWPWLQKERQIKYSGALCCYRAHEFREDLTTSRVKLWSPTKSTFTTDLNFIDGQERSLWRRHGYKRPDGGEISFTSHQIRHFLNTLAQRGSLGQLDIAKWSGRANVHQNAVYNHMTDSEYFDLAKEVGIGGALEKIRINAPVTYGDLDGAGDGIAHITLYGFCMHDYSMVPCQKHRDCLNCTEQVCVKGDKSKLERLKETRQLTQAQLIKAKEADESGTYGADRWSRHQIKTLERLDQLIQMLESPDLPDGTVVRLSNDQEHSPLKRELTARNDTNKIADPEPSVDELRVLLGVF